MPQRSDGAPHSVIIPISELRNTGSDNKSMGAPGTDCARFYAPSLPDSKGIVVRGARLFVSDEIATATGNFNIRNQGTTMLSTTVTATAVGSSAFTLAENGTEIVPAGNYIRIDATAGGGSWDQTNGFNGVTIQIDYDRLGN